jgi:hypothetical protein
MKKAGRRRKIATSRGYATRRGGLPPGAAAFQAGPALNCDDTSDTGRQRMPLARQCMRNAAATMR